MSISNIQAPQAAQTPAARPDATLPGAGVPGAAAAPGETRQAPAPQAQEARKAVPEADHSTALKRALEEMQNEVGALSRELNFSFDEDAGRIVVKILDSDSGEVLKQIPSEDFLRVARAIQSRQEQGVFVKDQA